jgi:hypothetical protein
MAKSVIQSCFGMSSIGSFLQILGERINWDAPGYMHAIKKNGSIEMNDSCMHGCNAIL